MLEKVLNILAAIEPQGLLETIQIQTPTFCVDNEKLAVCRKLDRFRTFGIEIVKVHQPGLIDDFEGLLWLLCR